MNILEKFGFTPVIGTVGAFGTLSIGKVNEVLALAIGFATLVFTIGKCIEIFRILKKK
jgi:hypothetical protein